MKVKKKDRSSRGDDYCLYSESLVNKAKDSISDTNNIQPYVDREPHVRLFFDQLTQKIVSKHLTPARLIGKTPESVMVTCAQLIKTSLWVGMCMAERLQQKLHAGILDQMFAATQTSQEASPGSGLSEEELGT